MNIYKEKEFLIDFFTRLKAEKWPGAGALLLIIQNKETSYATIQGLYNRVKNVSWETITKHDFQDELNKLKSQLSLS